MRRQTDGSYRFEGHAFDARIDRDGTVEFENRRNASLLPLLFSDKSDKVETNLFSSDFDLNDMVEKNLLNKENYAYEKRRFLRETVELREQLARAHREAFDARAKRRLLGRLILIREDNSKTNSAKRVQVFAIGDDCSDDSVGRQAQELIERFIREEMPEGSALGFSQEEIGSFNRGRVSQRLFNPYSAHP